MKLPPVDGGGALLASLASSASLAQMKQAIEAADVLAEIIQSQIFLEFDIAPSVLMTFMQSYVVFIF